MDFAMMSLMQPFPDGLTVKIMPKPTDVEGLADVLIGSLGLAGVMVLAGVVLALLFAGGLYLFRLKFGDPYPSASEHELGSNGQGGNITR